MSAITQSCHCGNRQAHWHGDPEALRVFCCDACWRAELSRVEPWPDAIRSTNERGGAVVLYSSPAFRREPIRPDGGPGACRRQPCACATAGPLPPVDVAAELKQLAAVLNADQAPLADLPFTLTSEARQESRRELDSRQPALFERNPDDLERRRQVLNFVADLKAEAEQDAVERASLFRVAPFTD